ncbi:A24 family peptidase [Noviherbaspirillum galbum]|uniref:Prepilin peptidase n=1 Tax=Noviherbaspirillum galbum TaxID=2709383 RepID=A0A6B3SKF6_9BURK|nr:prepilin peptidase [Noviherbaspirillum galbum]NEX61038.1 prepilin peptidase [Noviherbaspirillum galbum]
MNELDAFLTLLAMLLADLRTDVLMALLIVAAVIDFRTYRIPNWLTMSGALFGLAYSIAVPFSPQAGFLSSLGGLAIGLAIMLPMYVLRVTGAGDVKLIAMSGTFLGAGGVLPAIVCSFVVGGMAALGVALFRRSLGRMITNIKNISQSAAFYASGGMLPNMQVAPGASVGRLPYAVSIAVGTIAYLVARQLGFL